MQTFASGSGQGNRRKKVTVTDDALRYVTKGAFEEGDRKRETRRAHAGGRTTDGGREGGRRDDSALESRDSAIRQSDAGDAEMTTVTKSRR